MKKALMSVTLLVISLSVVMTLLTNLVVAA